MKGKLNGPITILMSIAASIGTVGTTVMAVSATPKAIRIIEEDSMVNHNGDPTAYTKKEAFISAWKCYIPSAIVGAATIACIFGSCVLSRRQVTSLMSAYLVLDRSFKEYKKKANELYGENANREIQKEVVKDIYEGNENLYSGENIIFYEEHYGKLFERTPIQVLTAEYELNKKLALNGEASVNDFLELLGLDTIDFGDSIGWLSDSNYDFYGHPWIEFRHEKIVMDDGMECEAINIDTMPSAYY